MLTAQVALNVLNAQRPSVITTLQPAFSEQMNRYGNLSINAEVACWPDDIRDVTKAFATWHYHSTCYKPTDDPSVKCPKVTPGLLFEALAFGRSAVIQSLSVGLDKPDALETAAFWVSFIVHVIGDAHQPLHMCSTYSDRFPNGDIGGNRFIVNYDDRSYKMHVLCDDGGGMLQDLPRPLVDYPTQLNEFYEKAKALQATYHFSHDVSKDLSPTTWAQEGFSLCAEAVYLGGMLEYDATLTDDYMANLRKVLMRRVTLGGIRLAYYLMDLVDAV